jgi:hypothetical protein
MGIKLQLEGKRFGRLVVLKESENRTTHNKVKWICRCDCGAILDTLGASLKGGLTKSCGCLRKETTSVMSKTHGLRQHPLYDVYGGIKARCYNLKNKCYKYYGGRGITMCEYWLESFENFYKDVGASWKKGLELDRIDNDKGYSKGNCRWVTHQQNCHNKGSNLNSASKYKGVYKAKKSGWYSTVKKEGKKYTFGKFTCEKEAALAYNEKALELFGEYAYLNKTQ